MTLARRALFSKVLAGPKKRTGDEQPSLEGARPGAGEDQLRKMARKARLFHLFRMIVQTSRAKPQENKAWSMVSRSFGHREQLT